MIDPFDQDLGIQWGLTREAALLSAKDGAAPSLAQARDNGLLPDYSQCKRHYDSLR